MNLRFLLSLVHTNPKKRFQVAIQEVPLSDAYSSPSVARDAGSEEEQESANAARGAGDEGSGRWVHYAIRACSGHTYPFIETHRVAVR